MEPLIAFASALYGYGDLPGVWRGPVFPQIDALPGAQITTAMGDWYSQVIRCQYVPDVGGHIIRTFVTVGKGGIAIGHQS